MAVRAAWTPAGRGAAPAPARRPARSGSCSPAGALCTEAATLAGPGEAPGPGARPARGGAPRRRAGPRPRPGGAGPARRRGSTSSPSTRRGGIMTVVVRWAEPGCGVAVGRAAGAGEGGGRARCWPAAPRALRAGGAGAARRGRPDRGAGRGRAARAPLGHRVHRGGLPPGEAPAAGLPDSTTAAGARPRAASACSAIHDPPRRRRRRGAGAAAARPGSASSWSPATPRSPRWRWRGRSGCRRRAPGRHRRRARRRSTTRRCGGCCAARGAAPLRPGAPRAEAPAGAGLPVARRGGGGHRRRRQRRAGAAGGPRRHRHGRLGHRRGARRRRPGAARRRLRLAGGRHRGGAQPLPQRAQVPRLHPHLQRAGAGALPGHGGAAHPAGPHHPADPGRGPRHRHGAGAGPGRRAARAGAHAPPAAGQGRAAARPPAPPARLPPAGRRAGRRPAMAAWRGGLAAHGVGLEPAPRGDAGHPGPRRRTPAVAARPARGHQRRPGRHRRSARWPTSSPAAPSGSRPSPSAAATRSSRWGWRSRRCCCWRCSTCRRCRASSAPRRSPGWPGRSCSSGPLALLAVDEGAKWVGRRRAARRLDR